MKEVIQRTRSRGYRVTTSPESVEYHLSGVSCAMCVEIPAFRTASECRHSTTDVMGGPRRPHEHSRDRAPVKNIGRALASEARRGTTRETRRRVVCVESGESDEDFYGLWHWSLT